mmetsp:Transcript_29804/g.74534  ORF Transcript_29804/g.74534 Transcript_29804/m.74534 type:complete len:249 (+) Transcript_29804:1461-2207(+)
MSTSAMFCMDVSRRPPRMPFTAAGLLRFTSMPGNAPLGELSSASCTLRRPMYNTLVLAGNADSSEPGATGSSEMPCCCSTVYSTLEMPYDHVRVRASCFSTSTLTPSAAPRCRSQLANPSALSPLAPTPDSARRVVSVPAMGLVICLTTPPVLPFAASHVKTPWSCISFQMAPCPPGLSARLSSPLGTQRPAWVVTTGTRGCSKRRKPPAPRPNQPWLRMSAEMRRWLPFAADVMIATGVTCCFPCSL